jgi:translation initiation factor 4G
MTSTAQPPSNSVNVPSANSQSVAQGSQRPPSYANATKGKQPSPPANASITGPLVVGGLASSQHAPHANTASPVNGRPSVPPAVPAVGGGPAIVNSASIANGTPSQSEHIRKPSVTISAQGTSGYLPNGSNTGPAVRPPINFGSINNASPSPNMANSTPHMHQNSLSASFPGPARSPSPIPQPNTASGGRPPSTLSAQGSVNFGQLPGADGSDQTVSVANDFVVNHNTSVNTLS